jgi:hypothetical protein
LFLGLFQNDWEIISNHQSAASTSHEILSENGELLFVIDMIVILSQLSNNVNKYSIQVTIEKFVFKGNLFNVYEK